MIANKIGNSKSLVIKRTTSGSYGFSSDDAELVAIGFFLTHDCIQLSTGKIRDWVLNPASDETGGNATTVKKINENIEITWDIDETEETRVCLPVEEFICMLEQWEKVEAFHPTSVKITLIDNSKVTLEILDIGAPSGMA